MPSVTRSPSDRRERRAAAEGKIVAALERLLARGERFTTLGVQRIADEAGVARSTFYVHFADKTVLLLRLADTTSASIFATAEAWADDGEPTLERLREALAAILADFRAHAPAYAALSEVAAYDPEVAAYWSARVEGFSAVLRSRIEARRGADGDGPLHSATATRWMAWGLERVIGLQAQQDADGDDTFVDELAAALWAALWADERGD